MVSNQEEIERLSSKINLAFSEVSNVIVGQKDIIKKVLLALLCEGHVLIEGVPGLAKTLLVNTLSNTCDSSFTRIQFTPDLLPSDILGTKIYNSNTNEFYTKKGPIFVNFVLADEINRAPPKVQSALLEAMQEKQVSIQGDTFPLPKPFVVLATQNPIEQQGTYPLPEAEMDRFLFKLIMNYPIKNEEVEVIKRFALGHEPVSNKVISTKDIIDSQNIVKEIYCDDALFLYVASIVEATRYPKKYNLSLGKYISYGASPRASIGMIKLAKANAFFENRNFVKPDDILAVAYDVLRHRIVLNYEADVDNVSVERIIEEILSKVISP
jgi:MoxR-like ATPase